MYVLKKKVVILFIALIVFFTGEYIHLLNGSKEHVLDIAIVSPVELQYETSITKTLTNNISNVALEYNGNINDNSEYNKIVTSNYQVENDKLASKKVEDAINNNDVIFVVGNAFNDVIETLIVDNPEKQFVLIENKYEKDYSNVAAVNFDYKKVFKEINSQKTDTDKYIYVVDSTNESNSSSMYGEFISLIGNKDSVVLLDISKMDDASIMLKLNELFNQGYNKLVVTTEHLLRVSIETVIKYNEETIEYNESLAEQQETNATADDEETVTEDGTGNSVELATVSILKTPKSLVTLYAIGDDTLIAVDEEEKTQLILYPYEFSSEVTEIIEQALKGNLVSTKYIIKGA